MYGPVYVFTALSGVRQGCPLSSTIFVIVTDCILRALQDCISSSDLLRAYADDIGMVMKNFWDGAGLVMQMFEVIGRIANLKLNHKKCNVQLQP